MKRILLLALVVGVLAGQASAGMYYMDVGTIAALRDISWSDTATGNDLYWVGYNPGAEADATYGSGPYGRTMYYDVGFAGNLRDGDSSGDAYVLFGADYTSNTILSTIQNEGTFDGFGMSFSNDNDDIWEVQLYIEYDIGAGVVNTFDPDDDAWTQLSAGETANLALSFTEFDFDDLIDIGFAVRMPTLGASDDFHISLVPVPAAVILGMLGLGVVGLKLRKYA